MAQMNLSTKQKRTHRHREQTCGCQGRRKDWEFGVSRCKLAYTGWINNKILLYSTGNYIQSPGINHNGKEYEKECRDFPGGAVVKTLQSQCSGPGFDPGQGTRSHIYASTRSSHATAKEPVGRNYGALLCNQIIK